MKNHIKLNKIPLEDYDKPGCQYAGTKEADIKTFEQYYQSGCLPFSSIAGTFHNNMNTSIEENGMEKFVADICAVLFSLKHCEKENKYFDEVKADIKDFETGEYDDLFTKEDLRLINEDIDYIKKFK